MEALVGDASYKSIFAAPDAGRQSWRPFTIHTTQSGPCTYCVFSVRFELSSLLFGEGYACSTTAQALEIQLFTREFPVVEMTVKQVPIIRSSCA